MVEPEVEKPSKKENVEDTSNGSTKLLTFVVLTLCWIVGFASRLFAIIRFESIIHEFDPWWVYMVYYESVCQING